MIETPSPSSAPVDVVLPCPDEAEVNPWVLGRIPSVRRAIVVDTRSTGNSADIARAVGAHVAREPRRDFGARPPHARSADREPARLIRRCGGLRLHDLGPMRAARREVLQAPAPHREALRALAPHIGGIDQP
ncbi:hypothetical protein [Streptomyces alanosinicus]|uniref:Glycosyltransferase n=1 Tax=Streptomyces alanosinicus TaxID=68171 RepID=A0A918YRL5_9ACTN|nr:hypothetical protein GCM10010339_76430 [Streptomyces alanosinicus]